MTDLELQSQETESDALLSKKRARPKKRALAIQIIARRRGVDGGSTHLRRSSMRRREASAHLMKPIPAPAWIASSIGNWFIGYAAPRTNVRFTRT